MIMTVTRSLLATMVIVLSLLALQAACAKPLPDYVPQQIRLAYGSSPSEMSVTWASGDEGTSTAWFGLKPNALQYSAVAASTYWTYGNQNGTHWTYRALLQVSRKRGGHDVVRTWPA